MVRRLTSPRLEFEAAAIYEYPEHLRSFLNDLPTRPGCICFMAKVTPCRSISAKALTSAVGCFLIYAPLMKPPCYGNPDASAGYVPPVKSALCSLEARLIKEQQPLFNKRLRRNRQLCALQLNEKRVDVVYAKEVDFHEPPTCLACLPIGAQLCKHCRPSLMNKNFVMACWDWSR